MAEAPSIKAIDTGSVHRITSGQVVVDLQTAVKELMENSLDAGATTIEIRVKENGLGTIEVVDNGKGIPKEDHDFVALKHHTSKLTSFENIAEIETFGFRGEALSSLCALCESVTVTTATSEDTPMATVLEFDRIGRVLSRAGKVARSRGTTVMLRGLFTPLPVRRKEFERHAKREFGKVLTLISAYALVPCSQENGGVKLTLMQVSETGKKALQIQTDGSPSLKSSMTALWGSKAVEQLVPVAVDLLVEPDTSTSKRRSAKINAITVQISGFISRFAPGSGRPSNDRQFFFVNGRPCSFPKAQKAINEIYRSFNALQNPVVIMDFRLPRDSTDVNVSPDKRTIFIHHEENLIEQLKLALIEQLGSDTSSFVINGPTKDQAPAPTITQPHRTRSTADIPEPDQIVPELLTSVIEEEVPLFLPSDDPPFPAPPHGGVTAVTKDILEEPAPSAPPSSVTSPRNVTPDEEENRGRENTKRLSLKRKASGSLLRSPSFEPAEAADPPPLVPRGGTKESTASITQWSHSGPVQMVLSTTGASWALQKGPGGPSNTSMKSAISKPPVGPNSALKGMRGILNQFKRGNVGMAKEAEDEDEDEENDEEMIADEVVELETPAKSDDSTMDVDEARLVPWIPVPTPDPIAVVTAPRLVEVIGTNPQVQAQSSLQEPSDPLDLGMVVPEIDGSSRRTTDECSPIKVPSEGEVEGAPDDEVIRSFVISTTTVRFDLASVEASWRATTPSRSTSSTSAPDRPTSSLCTVQPSKITSSAGEAEATLSRVVSKDDFERMDVLGQFNRAFVITRLCKTAEGHDDLFIVDQHAADEKYNFERLQAETRIESQKLIKPRQLSFSAADRLVAMENLDVLQRNGFEVGVSEDGSATMEELVLIAQPVSKSTVFDMKDLEELVSLLHDAPPGRMVRCSKARAMFASRACRSSVMVGDTLNPAQLISVVRHMGTMDQPWNCPHGRPTMRHLASIPTTALALKISGGRTGVNWGNFVE